MCSAVNESDRLPPLAQLAVGINNMLKRTLQTKLDVLLRSSTSASLGIGYTKEARESGFYRAVLVFSASTEDPHISSVRVTEGVWIESVPERMM
jgi:hypothetical protein